MFAWERTRPPKPMDSVRITAFLLSAGLRLETEGMRGNHFSSSLRSTAYSLFYASVWSMLFRRRNSPCFYGSRFIVFRERVLKATLIEVAQWVEHQVLIYRAVHVLQLRFVTSNCTTSAARWKT